MRERVDQIHNSSQPRVIMSLLKTRRLPLHTFWPYFLLELMINEKSSTAVQTDEVGLYSRCVVLTDYMRTMELHCRCVTMQVNVQRQVRVWKSREEAGVFAWQREYRLMLVEMPPLCAMLLIMSATKVPNWQYDQSLKVAAEGVKTIQYSAWLRV